MGGDGGGGPLLRARGRRGLVELAAHADLVRSQDLEDLRAFTFLAVGEVHPRLAATGSANGVRDSVSVAHDGDRVVTTRTREELDAERFALLRALHLTPPPWPDRSPPGFAIWLAVRERALEAQAAAAERCAHDIEAISRTWSFAGASTTRGRELV